MNEESEKADLPHPPSHYHLPSSGQNLTDSQAALSLLLGGADAAGVAAGVAGVAAGVADGAG